jgi:hypothetical protein
MSSRAKYVNLPEVVFLVEEANGEGFTARALGESIFTEAVGLPDLQGRFATRFAATSMRTRSRRSSDSASCARKSSTPEASQGISG